MLHDTSITSSIFQPCTEKLNYTQYWFYPNLQIKTTQKMVKCKLNTWVEIMCYWLPKAFS